MVLVNSLVLGKVGTPQMGSSEKSLGKVSPVFTSVSSRSEDVVCNPTFAENELVAVIWKL